MSLADRYTARRYAAGLLGCWAQFGVVHGASLTGLERPEREA